MEVRPHLSQHHRAARMPIQTTTATVTLVEPMDDNRNGEVELRAATLLRDDDHGDLVRNRGHSVDIDWDGVADLVSNTDDDELADSLADLLERFERPYPSLIRVQLDVHGRFDFVAGQYLTVTYRDTPRPYSISSSPNADEVELCIRRVPGGQLTSKLANHLSEGDETTVRGPYGDLTLEPPSDRDLVFLCTGTGVAPIRSMIEYTFEEDRDEGRDVWLFHGTGWRDDLAYREVFESLDERENFHYVPTLSSESVLTDWEGETAYVQRTLLKYVDDAALSGVDLPERLAPYADAAPNLDVDARIDPANVEVYACGINAMVFTLLDAVESLGVPGEHTQFEGFG